MSLQEKIGKTIAEPVRLEGKANGEVYSPSALWNEIRKVESEYYNLFNYSNSNYLLAPYNAIRRTEKIYSGKTTKED